MTREIDILTADDIVAFSPSDRQITLKLTLHERVPPNFLGRVTETELFALQPYISPFKMWEIEKWVDKPGFFEWLLTPDSFTIAMHRAKAQAAETIIDLLNIDVTDDTVDSKKLMIKFKAAELLLKNSLQKEQKTNQVLNLKFPKHLASKSVEALEEDLKKLKGI